MRFLNSSVRFGMSAVSRNAVDMPILPCGGASRTLVVASSITTIAGALAWPVAHIANIAPLAVAVNVVLVLGFASLLWQPPALKES